MATRPHATTEEQTAALGNVQRKPMQGDLLTGEFSTKKLKAGRGSHVALHRSPDQPVKAPGMAYFPGTGPEGKYCRDCEHCGDLSAKRGKWSVTIADACAKAKEITGRVDHGGISTNRACKYFVAKDEQQ